ncbi:hypothetical protein EDB84DRAFT_1447235 [Lactarius hengduanensis]|nr:hypothetical protein EDB84DRAFT_1447235 [Lactarius hengduanensis]
MAVLHVALAAVVPASVSLPPLRHHCRRPRVRRCVTLAATLRVTIAVTLDVTATVALRDAVVIDLVAVVVGVVAAGIARRVGMALRRLLRAVGGNGASGLVRGDGLEAGGTGLCAARWRRRRQWGLEWSVTQLIKQKERKNKAKKNVS